MKKILSIIIMMILIGSMSIGAFASSNFTKSVTAKPAPQIKKASIVDKSNNVLSNVSKGNINVIAYADRDKASTAVKSNLENAYDEIQKNGVEKLTPDVAKHIKNENSSVKPDELVVRDIFEVTLNGDAKEQASNDNNKIKITFDAKWNKDQYLMVMVKDNGKWTVLQNEDVIVNNDGTVTVTFSNISTVLFVTDGGSLNIDKDTTSPQTNDISGKIIGVVSAAAICTVSGIVIKKKENK